MVRKLKIVLALALVACAAAAYADPPGRVGRLNHAAGAVSFAPADAPDQWTQAPLNRPLTAGDRLWADSNGRAEVHVGSTALRMGAQTSVDVLNLDDHALQLRLAQGSINLRVRELAQGDTIEIATPAGAVLIRQPGSYRVSSDPQGGASRVAVNFGQAEVVTPAQTFTVPSSQAASFAMGASPSFEIAGYASDRRSRPLERRARPARRSRRLHSLRVAADDGIRGPRSIRLRGARSRNTARSGCRRASRPAGRLIATATGYGSRRGAGRGSTMRRGVLRRSTMGAGCRTTVTGRGRREALRRVRSMRPALVAFVGGPNFSVTVSSGPAVGWFPLGWREPYFPSYRASPTYVRNVNVTHVTNVTNVTNIYNNSTNVSSVNYVNRTNPQAVTAVPRQAFVSAQPVAQASVNVAPAQLAKAEVIQAKAPAQPVRASFALAQPGQRPPSTATAREVVAVTAPPKPAAQASLAPQDAAASSARRAENEPRVRVIGRERGELRADKAAPQAADKASPQTAGTRSSQAADPRSPQAPDSRPPQAPDSRSPQAARPQRAPQPGAPAKETTAAPAVTVKEGAGSVPRPPEGTAVVPRPPDNAAKGAPRQIQLADPPAMKLHPKQHRRSARSAIVCRPAQTKGPAAQSAAAVRAQDQASAKARAERREQRRAAPPEAAQKPSAAETAPRPPAEREQRREQRREPAARSEPPANVGFSREQRAPERAEQAMAQRRPQPAPVSVPRAEPPRAQAAPAESPRTHAPQPDAKSPQAQSRQRDGRPRPERSSQPPREGAPQAAAARTS